MTVFTCKCTCNKCGEQFTEQWHRCRETDRPPKPQRNYDIDELKLLMSEALNELECHNRGPLPEVRKFKRRIDKLLNIERNE